MDQLPEDKIKECKEIFDLFDHDADGSIEENELLNTLRALGLLPLSVEVDQQKKELSKGTGKIKFCDFIEYFSQKWNESNPEQELIEAFKLFDEEDKGTIEATKFRQIMTTIDDKLTESEIDQIFNELGTHSEGQFNYIDFITYYMNKRTTQNP